MLLADPIAIRIAVAAVAVTTVVAIAVVVVSVSGGTGCRSSHCCGPDRRSAIRIISATIGRSTISRPAIGHATARNSAATIGHATARNSTAANTYRANPSAGTGATTTVSESVIGSEGHSHEESGCETYDSIAQHWCSPSDNTDGLRWSGGCCITRF
jgi:hypothetical protein